MNKGFLCAMSVATFLVCQVASAEAEFRPMVGVGNSDYEFRLDNEMTYMGSATTEAYGLKVISDNVFIEASFSAGSGELDDSEYEFESAEESYSLGVMADERSIYLSYYSAESLVTVPGGQVKFKPKGWRYGWSGPVSSMGSGWLGYSFGLAIMTAEVSRVGPGNTVVSETSDNSLCYNAGLDYTYPVTQAFTVHGEVKYNVNEYKFDSMTREQTFTHYLLTAAYQF